MEGDGVVCLRGAGVVFVWALRCSGTVSLAVGLGLGFNMGFCCIRGFYSGDGLGGYTICAYGLLVASQLVDIGMLWVGGSGLCHS